VDSHGETRMIICRPISCARFLKISYVLVCVIFLLLSIYLAMINNNPGNPDSKSNLDTARNIYHGEGFTSHVVLQHFKVQALPGPELIRAPGIPYLLAGLFALFGISLTIPVIINMLTVFLSSLLLRSLLNVLRRGYFADIAGILMILSANYEMVSIRNNNFLVLWTIGLLYITVLYLKRGYSVILFSVLCAIVCASGFYIKQTFVLSAIPIALYTIMFYQHGRNIKLTVRVMAFVGFLLITLSLISPLIINDLEQFGKFPNTPLPLLRLFERYDSGVMQPWRTVHFDGPVTYRELAGLHGIGWVIIQELLIWIKIAVKILLLNVPLVVMLLAGVFLYRKFLRWPIFWPVYPVLIVLAGLLLLDVNANREPDSTSSFENLYRKSIGVFLACSIIFGAVSCIMLWKNTFETAREPQPQWITSTRQIPSGSIIMTYDPWSAVWYSENLVVMCPVGSREDLEKVLEIYKPDYYLRTGEGFTEAKTEFEDDELTLVAGKDKPDNEWAFYKINFKQHIM
jgi:hypothetical protein